MARKVRKMYVYSGYEKINWKELKWSTDISFVERLKDDQSYPLFSFHSKKVYIPKLPKANIQNGLVQRSLLPKQIVPYSGAMGFGTLDDLVIVLKDKGFLTNFGIGCGITLGVSALWAFIKETTLELFPEHKGKLNVVFTVVGIVLGVGGIIGLTISLVSGPGIVILVTFLINLFVSLLGYSIGKKVGQLAGRALFKKFRLSEEVIVFDDESEIIKPSKKDNQKNECNIDGHLKMGLCIFCYEKPANMILITNQNTFGHASVCSECYQNKKGELVKCPVSCASVVGAFELEDIDEHDCESCLNMGICVACRTNTVNTITVFDPSHIEYNFCGDCAKKLDQPFFKIFPSGFFD